MKRERKLIAILALVILLFPLLTRNPYYLNVANIVGLNALVVIGLTLLIGYAGQISLGHGAFYGMGAYISAILSTKLGINPWITLLIALVITAAVAVLIGIPTLRLKGHYLVMATLGFNIIVYMLMVQLEDITGGPSGFPGIPYLSIGNFSFDSDFKCYWLIWGVTLSALFISVNLIHSRVGRALRAIRESETAAGCFGIEILRYKVKIFLLSALFASIGGSLYAHYMTFISPKTFDIFYSIELVGMVIIGGIGSIWGALIGAAFLTPLPHILRFFDEYKDLIYGLIFMGVLIYSPDGLLGGLSRLYSKKRLKAALKRVSPESVRGG